MEVYFLKNANLLWHRLHGHCLVSGCTWRSVGSRQVPDWGIGQEMFWLTFSVVLSSSFRQLLPRSLPSTSFPVPSGNCCHAHCPPHPFQFTVHQSSHHTMVTSSSKWSFCVKDLWADCRTGWSPAPTAQTTVSKHLMTRWQLH